MHCAGFNSDTYDRYVLGLLEEPDRSQLETQIQEQCPACLRGVQRSMNLWLVFAETLENAEPSEDFRGRIVRIAELSRKVLTFPKDSAVRERSSVPISTLIVICAVTCILLVATWYAARAWTRVDLRSDSTEVENLATKLGDTQYKLEEEIAKRQKAESAVGTSGSNAIQTSKAREDQLSKAQAQAEQYKNALEHSKQQVSLSATFLEAFASPGARLFPMKTTEAAGKAVGYVILIPKARLLFVGSNLPEIPDGHTLQLWVLRSESPAPNDTVAATFMPPGVSGTWAADYKDAAMLTNVTGIVVSEEVTGGDYTKPTGPKLFEVTTVEPKVDAN